MNMLFDYVVIFIALCNVHTTDRRIHTLTVAICVCLLKEEEEEEGGITGCVSRGVWDLVVVLGVARHLCYNKYFMKGLQTAQRRGSVQIA